VLGLNVGSDVTGDSDGDGVGDNVGDDDVMISSLLFSKAASPIVTSGTNGLFDDPSSSSPAAAALFSAGDRTSRMMGCSSSCG